MIRVMKENGIVRRKCVGRKTFKNGFWGVYYDLEINGGEF